MRDRYADGMMIVHAHLLLALAAQRKGMAERIMLSKSFLKAQMDIFPSNGFLFRIATVGYLHAKFIMILLL